MKAPPLLLLLAAVEETVVVAQRRDPPPLDAGEDVTAETIELGGGRLWRLLTAATAAAAEAAMAAAAADLGLLEMRDRLAGEMGPETLMP